MLPSIGYSAAAGTGAADRASNRNAARNSAQSKDESFDQVFSATVSDSGTPSNRAQTSSGETPSQPPVAKKSDAGPSAAQPPDARLADLQPPDTSATATVASAPAASPAANATVPVGPRQPAPVDSTAPVRRPRNSQPVTDKGVGLTSASAGAAIDPSSLTMLLGAGTARAVNPTQEPNVTSNAPDGPETQPVIGLEAPAQKNTAGSDEGLAFALRLSSTPAAAPASDSPSSPSGSFANVLAAAAGKAVAEIKTRLADDLGSGASAAGMNALESAAGPAAATGGKQAAEPAPTASSASAPELPSQPSEPVRAVRVQLATEGNQRVDLTLVERAGTLSVGVRSADSNLTRALQEHLPDLSARLAGERYQTELWTPRAEPPSLSSGQGGISNPAETGRADRTEIPIRSSRESSGTTRPSGCRT